MLTSRIDRAVPFRVLEKVRHSVRVQHAGRDLSVPIGPGTRAWARWRPSWKSQLVAEALSQRAGVFVDVGANVGQTLLDYLAVGPAGGYVGFEPIPACAAFVQAVIDENNLVDCSLVPVALSDNTDVLPIYVPPDDSASATVMSELRPGRRGRTAFIPCQRFDLIWPRLEEGRRIALVKVDVEGAELEALGGMIETLHEQRPPILCEVLLADERADMDTYDWRMEKLELLLHELGYTAQRIQKEANQFVGLEAVDTFPRQTWTTATAEDCDYMLSFVEQRSLVQ